MSIRVRNPHYVEDGVCKTKTLNEVYGVCAAEHDPEPEDVYLDDAAHYLLVGLGLLVTYDEGDTWKFRRPHAQETDVRALLEAVLGK